MFTSELLADSFQNFRTYRIDPWDFLTELDPGVECKSVITADRVGPNSGSTSNRVSEADAPALSPKATQNLTASERKQEKNRLAQKRFRQRKKVPFKPRSQCSKHAWDKETSFFQRPVPENSLALQERSSTTEAQLAETTSQLQALKLRQKQLEVRNTLLEQLATLNKQHSLQEGPYLTKDNQYIWQVAHCACICTVPVGRCLCLPA